MRNATLSKKHVLGQGMTEYIIIVILVAIAAIGAFTYFGKTARNQVAGMSMELAGQSADDAIDAARTAANAAETAGDRQKGLASYNQDSVTAN